jgi:hypothetical protein
MPDLIARLVSLFLIEPLQAEIGANLGAARIPHAVLAAVAAGARTAAPVIAERAGRDPRWAAASAVRLWVDGRRRRRGSSKPHPVVPPRSSPRPPPTGQAA